MIKSKVTNTHRYKLQTAMLEKRRRSFLYFKDKIIVPSAHGNKRMEQVEAEFQRECFEAMAPSLDALRLGSLPPIRRFWLERTKGASKDTDIAIVLTWLVIFSDRSLYGQVGAADRDQAGIVKRRAEQLLEANPWMQDHIQIVNNEIRSRETQTKIDILAADVTGGSHGETPDILILNELSHVQRWKSIEDLMSNADKMPRGIVIAATNAGFTGTETEKWRKIAQASSGVRFARCSKCRKEVKLTKAGRFTKH